MIKIAAKLLMVSTAVFMCLGAGRGRAGNLDYAVVDTMQKGCYTDTSMVACPPSGSAFYGQDAQYEGQQARYRDNGNGTISDLNTGLMWQKTPDLKNKSTFKEALAGAKKFKLAGYSDWRLPSVKELYSLIDFNGSSFSSVPYIDVKYFDFRFGAGVGSERIIDAQYWSATEYVGNSPTFGNLVFGVNFADGRIKGYPRDNGPRGPMTEFVRYVRGSKKYGINDFADNKDGTITDRATGLAWTKADSGKKLNWKSALGYCETLKVAGHGDWRLPNAKELQSIVDYTRSPGASDRAKRGPAIDPIFSAAETESWHWTSTTHLDAPSPDAAVYIAFGKANGIMFGGMSDVHGAGAQRSDPKSGEPADYARGRGPQGDEIRIYNYARCVRGGADPAKEGSGKSGEPSGGKKAAGGDARPQHGPGQAPPREALEACEKKSRGDKCSIATPHGKIEGKCGAGFQGEFLCVPAGMPGGGPPPTGR